MHKDSFEFLSDINSKILTWYIFDFYIEENGFGLVSLFNGISTFVGYSMPKPSL